MRRRPHLLIEITVIAFLLASRFAHAGSFEVAPTSIELKPSETAVFYLINHSTEPIVAQVEGYAWRQDETQTDVDQYDDTSDLIISPPMVRLMPKQRQTIRLMVKPNASAASSERTFRLIVSEIPDPGNAGPKDGVRMLLQFSVPVFMRSPNLLTGKLEWSAQKNGDDLTLTAQNEGQQHAKLSGITLETSSGQSLPVNDGKFRYILGGTNAMWTLPHVTAVSGQSVHVKAFDDIANASIDIPLTVQ
jgi:fimbrial chaperone protein